MSGRTSQQRKKTSLALDVISGKVEPVPAHVLLYTDFGRDAYQHLESFNGDSEE